MSSSQDHLHRLLAEAPFVRALARRLLADEADDVVQQTWLRALAQPQPLARPRAWLARLVRSIASDLRRRRSRRAAREQVAAAPERVPSSHELLELEERRRQLVAAVDALPKDQRAVVLLRYYEGLPPRRIAVQLGLPVATVWSRLHEALRSLRARLDREHGGDRRAWQSALGAFAAAPRSLPWREVLTGSFGGGFWLGVLAMAAKAKVAAATAAVMVVALAAWLSWSGQAGPRSPRAPGDGAPTPALARGEVADAGAAKAGDETQRIAVEPAASQVPTTGELIVHLRYANEPKTAAGLLVKVVREGGDIRVGVPRAHTDDTGTARIAGLAPGKVQLVCNRDGMRGPDSRAEIRAGATTECTFTLPEPVTVAGIVVDEVGVPIGGALVEAAPTGSTFDAEVVAVTAADGSFTVRAAFSPGLYGARAPGYSASQLYRFHGDTVEPRDQPLRIVLPANGGAVAGVVVDRAGAPIADAVVRVGKGVTEHILPTSQGAPPLPAQVRTDADGRFLALGVPAGTQAVQVRAPLLAPWQGSCEVAANGTAALRVVLDQGVTCLGVVRQEDGAPAAGMPVRVGQEGDFLRYFAVAAADGSFALHGLPTGTFEVWAHSYERGRSQLGRASVTLHGEPGATLHAELLLSNGLALRGIVVGEDDRPLPWVRLRCRAEGGGGPWSVDVTSDRDGRFVVPECPSGRTLSLEASLEYRMPVQLTGLVPGARELRLEMPLDQQPKAIATGRILLPDGSPAVGAGIRAIRWRWHQTLFGEQRDGPFRLQLPAGTWEVRIEADGFPMIFAGTRELQPGAEWDLGTIQLVTGGRLVAREQGDGKAAYLILTSTEEFRAGLYSPQPPLRSDPLPPGDYLLLVWGNGIAATALPFAIASGQETALRVDKQPGVRQLFEFVPAPGAKDIDSVRFEVRAEGRLLHWGFVRAGQDGRLTAELWLRPGRYEVATRDRQPAARATFTVAEAEGMPVRLELPR